MSFWRLVLRSLVYHRRTNLAVALGVAAGAAVLTGALLVGDSMRGSLRDLTLQRLGPVDEALVAGRFFREELAQELSGGLGACAETAGPCTAVPAVLLDASVENADEAEASRANGVHVVGCDQRFWALEPGEGPDPGEGAALNQPLADRLGVRAGGTVVVRLPDLGSIAGDSPLGKKRDTVQSWRLTVGRVLPTTGWLGRFALRPNQRMPLVAYVPLEGLQRRLKQPGRVNAILAARRDGPPEPPAGQHDLLTRLLRPTAEDYGIRIEHTDRGELSYVNVTTDRLIFGRAEEAAIRRALEGERFQAAFTYLANTIQLTKPRDPPVTQQGDDGRIVPYSTITAVDFDARPPLGPLRTPDGRPIAPLDDRDGPQIVLNSWAAESLGLKTDGQGGPRKHESAKGEAGGGEGGAGADVFVTFFEPENAHGQGRERTVRFRVAAVADLAGPARDRAFTPIVPGLTDKRSIDNWDVPFAPFYEGLVRKSDDEYYRREGLTPKAFVSLATGERLWGSRFGRVTSFRVVPSETATAEKLAERIRHGLDPAAMGFVFQPVKQQGLDASAGTTPFSLLFLGFSMFLIAAAVMLVALLFRLGIDARAEQLGILRAAGFSRRRVTRLLAAEGLLVAAAGSVLGALGGFGYAALMLEGLRTWWLAAIVTPFLDLHWTWTSLGAGTASGLATAAGAVWWAVWRSGRTSPRRLLAGETAEHDPRITRVTRKLSWPDWLAGAMAACAAGIGVFALRLGEMAQAGAFFGAGMLVLGAVLVVVGARLRRGSTGAAVATGRGNLGRLALRNAARNPGRSTLSVGLVAAASFLIVAISAFRLDPSGQTPRLASGNGGFSLVGQAAQPVFHDLNTPEGREALGGFSKADNERLREAETRAFALRLKPGDDASCLNLYQTRQPSVLGVPQAMIDRGGFAWSGSLARTPEERENPWRLLDKDPGEDADGAPLVPAVLDANTAQYSLHRGLGDTIELDGGRGNRLRLRVVGLLSNSILQGDLLISEAAFLRSFPEVSGYRFFLVETRPEDAAEVQNVLERVLGDYGFAAETSGQRLAAFLAVQNTYLSTFQSLGGLGLLLGTFGLGAVQLRNVLERRRELALLRAAGFRRALLAWLVTLENAVLLMTGLGCGACAALVAVLPHLAGGRAMVPWGSLAVTLGLVLAGGLVAGLAAVRAALRAPLLESLRGE